MIPATCWAWTAEAADVINTAFEAVDGVRVDYHRCDGVRMIDTNQRDGRVTTLAAIEEEIRRCCGPASHGEEPQ